MYYDDSQNPDQYLQEEDCLYNSPPSPPSCSQGHRSSLNLQTEQGGSICLLCFVNLISNSLSPTIHVSYALSQLSQALSQPQFLQSVLTFHSHFLVSSLVNALSSFDDEPIARQVIDLITRLCGLADGSVHGEFVVRVSDRLCSGDLAWSCRQVYMLHCLGLLLNCQTNNIYAHVKDKCSLISNLVTGLQLPSEEIRGEVLFVLYKLSITRYASEEGDGSDILVTFCPKLLYLLGEALMKTQRDDVRLNCVALLTVLAQRGLLREANAYDSGSMISYDGDNYEQATQDGIKEPSLGTLFAEAIKGPLLSSDSQVQISTLVLLFHYLSSEVTSGKQIQVLVDENIADYVFEILRLSEYKDPLVNFCLQVLDYLSTTGQSFKQRLLVGFSTLIPVLHYVAEVPFHPAQSQTLKLIWDCISEFPGALSASQLEELVLLLTRMLKMHTDGEMGMLPETFIILCSILVALIKSPSCNGILDLATLLKEASKPAVLSCLCVSERNTSQLLHCLYLIKEAYAYTYEGSSTSSSKMELRNCILDICRRQLLPWLVTAINEIEEETVLGLLEAFHSILLKDSGNQALYFVEAMISSCWFSFSFECLGLFTTDKMKWRVYLLLSLLVDGLLGNDSGQPIRDAALHLPSDPVDLLFLLGQKSGQSSELSSCQSAVLLIIYTSSLYDERLADEKLVLASLEQYILVNSSDLQCGNTDSLTVMRLVNLYGLLRGLAKISYQIPYSPEAERILFHLINEDEWDLLSTRIHPVSLKWLFQQEKISKSLSHQILKFCRSSSLETAVIIAHGNINQTVNVQTLAELVCADDNYGARILICLLTQLIKEDSQEPDIVSIVNFMATIIDTLPAAADQLCLHGIGTAIRILFYDSSQTFSSLILSSISVLIHNILHSVHPEALSDDETWLAVTKKMMYYSFTSDTTDGLTHENLFVIAILSLILHHSVNKALEEASKIILFNTYLVSAVNAVVHSACSKGPSLLEHDEETSLGEILISVLLLNYFSMKSLHAILPGIVDWQDFLDITNARTLSFISIHCHDLCRLLHFGSPVVKLIASYSLLELFSRISDQRNRKHEKLKCTMGYLMSIRGVLEGLIFYSDLRVAMNCGICLSMILGWEKLDMDETRVFGKNSWCRLIVEELTMYLAAPSSAYQSLTNYYKPSIYVAVALLKLQKLPEWMRSRFNDSCISGILENLAASNMNKEILVLFRQLRKSKFLNAKQIATLNRVLQACRKCLYSDYAQDDLTNEQTKKVVTNPYDLGEVYSYLICLMSSESHVDMDSWGLHLDNKSLLEEIEVFFRTLTVEDDN